MSCTFRINGKSYSVNLLNFASDITLNTFIREYAGLSGTKFMCQEGNCGVCICVVSGKHPVSGETQTWAVNSCLTLLNTCMDWEITTVEGLGNKRTGYHAIQKRLAKFNGTQCGYCSPGFVMNMYALLKSHGGKVSMEEVENSFGGNLCRCTGYRSILDAMKSFAMDSNIEVPAECADIEDLGKTCPKTGANCSGSCKSRNSLSILKYPNGTCWYWPLSVPVIFKAFEALEHEKYMLVAGNIGQISVSKEITAFIDVNRIAELKEHSITKDSIRLGANISFTEAMNVFEKAAQQPGFEYCRELWNHFDLIGNVPVRNMGTLIGNLCLKQQQKEFASDVYIVFEALNVQVVIKESTEKEHTISIAEFMKTPLKFKVVTAFVLRSYPIESYYFASYKIMPVAQNAPAYVNAAFLFNVEKPNNRVLSANICFGGLNPEMVHATQLEQLCVGQNLFDENLCQNIFNNFAHTLHAVEVLPQTSGRYRLKLAFGLLYKFLLSNAPQDLISARLASGGKQLQRAVSCGKQSFETVERNYPITQPIEKLEGSIQTSGEAAYANDLAISPNQLWAAFVTATKVGSMVSSIDASEALKLPGVVAFFDAKDIPGINDMGDNDLTYNFFPENEELFATGPIKFHNQPVGMIVAESNALANKAVNLVKLKYSEKFVDEVLPTLEQVLNSKKSAERLQHLVKSNIQELTIKENHVIKASGRIEMGLQYHYFLEPQTAVAIPLEGGLQIHSTTQWMDLVQCVVSKFLNLKNNEVQVEVRRLGGGFGGKGTRCVLVACAAALAAHKLNCPVRFVQSLDSMLSTLGKRWPSLLEYDFYAQKSGKIVGIRSVIYQDAGYLPNETFMEHTMEKAQSLYAFETDKYKLDGYVVLTDSPNNVACRAPGSVEGIALIETIMEQIAFETGLDPIEVRLANLPLQHKMRDMLPRFVKSSEYQQRRTAVNEFNKDNRWIKKGLGVAIMEYQAGYFGQYSATVAIYHGDGTVIISHGGIEMGQGMNTKIAQVAAHTLGIPAEMIRFERSDTLIGANSMGTGGSVGSESLCFAVRKCCNTLNERLQHIKAQLKDSKWQLIIEKAHQSNINLIASDYYKQGDLINYTICGLCLTEVDVDMLTGKYLISRVDLLQDTGESLNPLIDIGQIEGAFSMGLSYWTTEKFVLDKSTGALLTNNSSNYTIPGPRDIPIDFRLELLPNSSNSNGFMRSKASGEPSICLSVAVVFALQHALQSARDDAGVKKSWVSLSAPMTPEDVLLNSGIDVSMFKFK